MNGDIKHRIGCYLADRFDLLTDSFMLSLQNIREESFTKTQRLPKENGWLTRCLEYQDDKLVSLFCMTDNFYPDRNILLRSITNSEELNFKLDIYTKDHTFHEKYALRKHRFPAIQIIWGNRIIYIILSGDMSYDRYSGILKIMPGKHEILLAEGYDPKDILRQAYAVLTEDIKPDPVEMLRGELANAIDTALTGKNDYITAYSLKKLGVRTRLPKLIFDKESVIHGMLPFDDSDDGSSINTILYIKHSSSEHAKRMFKDNFVRGDAILLNSIKRRGFCRLPRFRYGVCQYCKAKQVWVEKTVHGSYACVHCYNEANIPSNIPEMKEYVSDIPVLLIIYLGLKIPTFDDIPSMLKRMSEKELDTYTLGLLLYAACRYHLTQKHELYNRLMAHRNDIGIWHGKTECCPVTNSVCAVAVTEYKRTEN